MGAANSKGGILGFSWCPMRDGGEQRKEGERFFFLATQWLLFYIIKS